MPPYLQYRENMQIIIQSIFPLMLTLEIGDVQCSKTDVKPYHGT